MKAIGARSHQIASLYVTMVLIFGLLAFCIAVPVGALAAYQSVGFISYMINFDLSGFRLEPQVPPLSSAHTCLPRSPMFTMSINVLERTREIAVMRAIGASDGAVMQLFVIESCFIGLLSWLLGVILAFPMGKVLSHAVGMQFLRMPLNYTFSLEGALLWLFLVALLSALAAYLPARDGVRISVREALAYE